MGWKRITGSLPRYPLPCSYFDSVNRRTSVALSMTPLAMQEAGNVIVILVEINDVVGVAVPVPLNEHVGASGIDPAANVAFIVRVDPESVPAIVPLRVKVPSFSKNMICSGPDRAVPVCATVQLARSELGPAVAGLGFGLSLVSCMGPAQAPARLIVVVVGDVGDPLLLSEPLQPAIVAKHKPSATLRIPDELHDSSPRNGIEPRQSPHVAHAERKVPTTRDANSPRLARPCFFPGLLPGLWPGFLSGCWRNVQCR